MSVSMVQVTLIRPGATLYDEQNRVQGILDIPLSDRGRAEAARLAESLAATQDSASTFGSLLRAGRERHPHRGDRGQGPGPAPQTDR